MLEGATFIVHRLGDVICGKSSSIFAWKVPLPAHPSFMLTPERRYCAGSAEHEILIFPGTTRAVNGTFFQFQNR